MISPTSCTFFTNIELKTHFNKLKFHLENWSLFTYVRNPSRKWHYLRSSISLFFLLIVGQPHSMKTCSSEKWESLKCVSHYSAYFATRTRIFLECKDGSYLLVLKLESFIDIWRESPSLQWPTYIKFSKPMTFTLVWWWEGTGEKGKFLFQKKKKSNPIYGY